jgi:hypothetical protein
MSSFILLFLALACSFSYLEELLKHIFLKQPRVFGEIDLTPWFACFFWAWYNYLIN